MLTKGSRKRRDKSRRRTLLHLLRLEVTSCLDLPPPPVTKTRILEVAEEAAEVAEAAEVVAVLPKEILRAEEEMPRRLSRE